MMNIQTICKDMADGVRDEIRQAIMDGKDIVEYTKEYGDTVVIVGVRSYWPYTCCVVSHEDSSHKSPCIEKAIENAVPDWYSVEREVASEYGYSLTDDELVIRSC